MRTHNYLCRINDDQWIDLMKIKSLDKRSFNSLIQEGCRLVVQEKLGKVRRTFVYWSDLCWPQCIHSRVDQL